MINKKQDYLIKKKILNKNIKYLKKSMKNSRKGKFAYKHYAQAVLELEGDLNIINIRYYDKRRKFRKNIKRLKLSFK